jgi:secreted trypsin-like serine protease
MKYCLRYFVAILFAISAFAVTSGNAKPSLVARSGATVSGAAPRIIGGEDAVDGEFPYMLELEYYGSLGWQHQCGAVLVNAWHAVVGAKCVATSNMINLRLWAGILVRGNYTVTNSQQISLNQVTVHPNYSEYNSGIPYDIAVLKFSWAADLNRDNIAVAVLPPNDSEHFIGVPCTIIGWGRYGDEQAFAITLQKATNTPISNHDCSSAMTGISNSQISEVHICTQSEPAGEGGACSGDAGSPLICDASYHGGAVESYVVGIASWTVMSNYMCNLNYPSVYTRLGYVRQWIDDNTAV